MTAALTAENLHTYYGKSHILHGVSLEAPKARSRHCSAATAPAKPRPCAA
jgi:ABC-type histidine transport system ATPase subunit